MNLWTSNSTSYRVRLTRHRTTKDQRPRNAFAVRLIVVHSRLLSKWNQWCQSLSIDRNLIRWDNVGQEGSDKNCPIHCPTYWWDEPDERPWRMVNSTRLAAHSEGIDSGPTGKCTPWSNRSCDRYYTWSVTIKREKSFASFVSEPPFANWKSNWPNDKI
jgi:hypothetical protein